MIEELINGIVNSAEQNLSRSESDYVDADGFLCCGVCGERKQTELAIGYLRGRKVSCQCACDREQQRIEEEKKRQERIRFRKERCFSHTEMYGFTFDKDNGKQTKLQYGKQYAENWQTVRKKNVGLLLLGSVGTGKTYCACAIANYLCERDIPVRFVNLAEVLNDLQSNPDRNEYIRSLTNYSLLIIDDFGIQRQTDYALEQVFNLIDNRDRSGKPLIVTTNLTLAELKHPESDAQKRIFDRLLKLCTPVAFDGNSMRIDESAEKRTVLEQIFSVK